ncbi:hypothetical protein [Micromonospora sp. NPDC023956]|uniref:hypothetical protein n=1 Tax=Micromonospora sp. NPDC023956 TaxID=3155722 RepID=UPI0033CE5D37
MTTFYGPRAAYDPYAINYLLREVHPPHRFGRGQRVKLADELGGGVVEIVDRYAPTIWQVKTASTQFLVSEHVLKKAAPVWQPGDVLVVRWHGPRSRAYTYVRGMKCWPGETASKTDTEMDDLFLAGKAEPVLQTGGVPFDKSRL